MTDSKGGRLFRTAENPNEFMALFEWDDLERARKFAASYELHEAVEWASVVGEWRANALQEVEEVSA